MKASAPFASKLSEESGDDNQPTIKSPKRYPPPDSTSTAVGAPSREQRLWEEWLKEYKFLRRSTIKTNYLFCTMCHQDIGRVPIMEGGLKDGMDEKDFTKCTDTLASFKLSLHTGQCNSKAISWKPFQSW